jgi:hypothetical protein
MRIFFLLIVFLAVNIYSQGAREQNIVFLPQGISLQTLNGLGTSNIKNDISNISSINPASLSGFGKLSVGVSYLFRSQIKEAYIANIGSSRIYNFVPQSFGIVYPINNLVLGFGMRQKYNSTLDIGNIEVTTAGQPDGIGYFYTPILRTTVYCYSIITSYLYDDFLAPGNELSLGFKAELNRFHEYEELLSVSNDQTDYSFGWSAGFTYKIRYNNNRDVELGLAYESNVEFRKPFSFSDNNSLIVDTSNRSINYISTSYLLKGDLPGELKFDVDINTVPNINFLMGFNYVFWSEIGNNLENQLEVSGNVIYSPNNIISSSIGFFLTGRKFKQDFFGENDKMNACFLTAGLKINFNYFDLDLSIADGNLLSGEAYKQTFGRFGVGFQL